MYNEFMTLKDVAITYLKLQDFLENKRKNTTKSSCVNEAPQLRYKRQTSYELTRSESKRGLVEFNSVTKPLMKKRIEHMKQFSKKLR